MDEFQLILSADEKRYLIERLEALLGETRSEVHHTRTPNFHEAVLREANLIRGLLAKLQPTS